MAEYLDVHLGSLPQLAAAHESVAGKWQGWPQGGDAFLSDLRNSHGAVSEPIARVLEQYQQRRVAHAADQAGAHQQVSEAITASLKTFRTQEEQNADRLSAPTVGDGVAKATDDQQQTKVGDTEKPKDPKGQIQAVDFDKNHAPAPLGPSHEIQKILPRWTDQDLYPHKPSAADIHQDTVGDCYLAATMGAIAHANPQWIKDRIHYNEQTTSFDVTLWNGHQWQQIPVTQHDIQTNIDHHGASWLDNGKPHAPLWPSVLENAYAKMHYPTDNLDHALDAGIGRGGEAHDAMQALTGNQGLTIHPEKVWFTRQEIDQTIAHALTNNQPVTISTQTDASLPLVAPHTYIVEGITGSGSDAQLTLRNPWESNPGDPNNPMVTARLGDLIGSGLTGKLDGFGTHPMSNVNIGELGQ